MARHALPQAEHEIDAGLAAMPEEASPSARFSVVAIHWVKGLLCLARGADDEAMGAFAHELALEPRGHLYGRECGANTWSAIGAVRLGRGDTTAACAAFKEAIARVPRHPMAHAALAIAGARGSIGGRPGDASPPVSMEVAIARAACLVARGNVPGAAPLVAAALSSAPPGSAGWTIPVEPLLSIQRDRGPWMRVLAELRRRAM